MRFRLIEREEGPAALRCTSGYDCYLKKKEIIVDEQQPNPFASPAVAAEAAIPEFDPDNEIREFSFGKSLTKWLLVCLVSAAPSFFFGSILEQEYVVQSLAMVSGILLSLIHI